MATSNYTPFLGMSLPTTGDLSGTWGTEVNNYITSFVDAAVAGTQPISGSQTSVSLTPTQGSSLVQAGSGATGSSQYQIINCTGNPVSTLTVTVDYSVNTPTQSNSTFSKAYIVLNATSTSQSVVVRAKTTTGTSTGVTIASGEKAVIVWNGSDFVRAASTIITNLTGTLPIANGGTNATATPTAGAVAYGTGTAYAFTSAGTTGQALTSNGTSAPSFGTLGVAGGGTGLATTTAYSVVFTGTTATGAFQASAGPGTAGQVLTSNGAGALPTFQASSGIGIGKAIAMSLIFGF